MIPDWARQAFGGQKDSILKEMAERESARQEIENTRWYKMLTDRVSKELIWVEKELRHVDIFHFSQLQAYGKALEVVESFIRVSRQGKVAGELLSERAEKNRKKTVDEHMEEVMGVPE